MVFTSCMSKHVLTIRSNTKSGLCHGVYLYTECNLNHRKKNAEFFLQDKEKKMGASRECEIQNDVLMFPTGESTASSREGFEK